MSVLLTLQVKDSLLILDISHNPMNHLPHCVSFLTQLEELHACNIGVVDLSVLLKLTELRHLDVGFNSIAQVGIDITTTCLQR